MPRLGGDGVGKPADRPRAGSLSMNLAHAFRPFAAALLLAAGAAGAQPTFQTVHQSQPDEWGTSIEREGTGYVMAGNIQSGNQQLHPLVAGGSHHD